MEKKDEVGASEGSEWSDEQLLDALHIRNCLSAKNPFHHDGEVVSENDALTIDGKSIAATMEVL